MNISIDKLQNSVILKVLTRADAKIEYRGRAHRMISLADKLASKINVVTAKGIRYLYSKIRSYSRVAKEYSVSKSLVAKIVRGELWA